MRPEIVPLLVVALLLVSTQPGVETVTTVVDGEQELSGEADAIIVVDGTVTVPADETTPAALYVVGGTARIAGTLDGRLVQLAGTVTVPATGAITGQYQVLGGDWTVADGAAVTPVVVAEPFTRERSPLEALGFFLLQAAVLAAVAFALGRRYPDLLANVEHAVRHHPVVSGTVGLLASVTGLALLVFMAFTLVLLPVSLLGLAAGLFVYLYAYVALGYLVGRLVAPSRPGAATAGGAVALAAAGRLLGYVPVVGDLLPALALVIAAGAVVVTYFGLREFHPPTLRPVE